MTGPVFRVECNYMERKFTAVYQKAGAWYLGWVEEIPGVNTQGKTLKETKENLRDALELVLETNRILLRKESLKGKIMKEPIILSS